MSRVVWKFNLAVRDEQTVQLPRAAELLSVGLQDPTDPSTIQLWAVCDPDAEREPHRISIHGTGHPLPSDLDASSHIGTVIAFGGRLVWHVFDGGREARHPHEHPPRRSER